MRKANALAELEEQIDKLGPEEKKQLLRRLIADLDDASDGDSPEDISAAWLQEAQRRFQELEDGTAIAVPADEAIARARERLRNVRRTSS